MGTKKRRLYQEMTADETPVQDELASHEVQKEDEVGMKCMLIGAVVFIIILIVAFMSPNF